MVFQFRSESPQTTSGNHALPSDQASLCKHGNHICSLTRICSPMFTCYDPIFKSEQKRKLSTQPRLLSPFAVLMLMAVFQSGEEFRLFWYICK